MRTAVVLAAALAVTVALTVAWTRQSSEPAAGAMSFEEYSPRSTLVVPEHPVPRAKYPVVDVHSHHSNLTPERWAQIVNEMDALNLRVLVNLSGGSGDTLRNGIETVRRSAHPDRMVFFATVAFREPMNADFGLRAARQVEEDVKAGALGLKIFKNFGRDVAYADGRRVPVDAPELDPVWAACARLKVPVLIHIGEPAPFFEPVDKFNERWLELTLRPERRLPPGNGRPAFDELVAERDRLFARHPRTRFIVAHMGWHANDLGRLERLLDRLPNIVVETGAILAELGRQPRTAGSFLRKYQDRVLFGKDSYAPAEYPYYWRTFETADEYFDYYRKYHAFWKLYGLDLPDEVLKKLYYANALRIVPNMPAAAFPREPQANPKP